MVNKFLIRLYVPAIETTYEIWLPPGKRIDNIISILVNAVYEQSKGNYEPKSKPNLFNKVTAQKYMSNLRVMDTDIRNGSELILI